MKFDRGKIQFVYIDFEYLKYMNSLDTEVHFDNRSEYKQKPHIGLLINQFDYRYVIPLTSAKEKHKNWDDVTASWFRIFEIVDTRKDRISGKDIIVDIKNQGLLLNIPEDERQYYKQKLLSVLDLRKMFPIYDGVYTPVPMGLSSSMAKEDVNRRNLLLKEYMFIVDIKDEIADKSQKIYDKQIQKGKILKYHCNYMLLEKGCDEYKANHLHHMSM